MLRIKTLLFCFIISFGLLTGCNNTSVDAPTKITIALDWTPNTNHTGNYVAESLGYFKEAGIEIEIIEALESGAEPVVASGTAEFGISFQDYLVPAFSAPDDEKLPITAIAAIMQHNTSGIISPKEYDITSPKKLAGHTYATWELPIEQAIVAEVMANDGADFSDLELIPQYVENLQGAFNSGIDSVWIYYGWDGINATLNELDTNFFYFKDYDDRLDFYSPVIIANNEYIKNHPDITRDFLNAVQKGYEYTIENPDKAAQILVESNEGMDLELCIKSQEWVSDKYIDDASQWGIIDSNRWNSFYEWVYENGLCEYEIPKDFGFTNEYLIDDGRQ
jgi:ABC-type nitrate/sulfonate/bicarbonate transport system substrate-binding protein